MALPRLATRLLLTQTRQILISQSGLPTVAALRIQYPAILPPVWHAQQRHSSSGVKKPPKPNQAQTSSSSSSSSSSDSDSDSSSDEEVDGRKPFGKRGGSAIWQRKMRTYHRVMDVNNDGTVSWDDFQEMARKFAELGHLSEQQQTEFAAQLKFIWENNWGASGDPYCFITEEALLTSMEHVVNTKDLARKTDKFLPYLFKAVDYNASDDISVDEYKLLFKCLGLSEEDAIVSFNSIDVNGDGTITLDEFVAHGKDFFLTEDETRPSKYFWGPLC